MQIVSTSCFETTLHISQGRGYVAQVDIQQEEADRRETEERVGGRDERERRRFGQRSRSTRGA